MKRIFSLMFLLLYSFAVLGSHVHIHYCMNKYAGWSILENPSDKECNRCGMKNTKCCKIEIKENKATSEQSITQQIVPGHQITDIQPVKQVCYSFVGLSIFKTIQQERYHAPPLTTALDFCATYCIYRI